MNVTIHITRRPEIADPQGATVARALHELGHQTVQSVRVDRTIHMVVEGEDREQIRNSVTEMCEQVLANPVLEDFEVVVG
jgi:phosphoribosylformylglycinamidine synthase